MTDLCLWAFKFDFFVAVFVNKNRPTRQKVFPNPSEGHRLPKIAQAGKRLRHPNEQEKTMDKKNNTCCYISIPKDSNKNWNFSIQASKKERQALKGILLFIISGQNHNGGAF